MVVVHHWHKSQNPKKARHWLTIAKPMFIKTGMRWFLGFGVFFYANHLLASYYFSGKVSFDFGWFIFMLSLACIIGAKAKEQAAQKNKQNKKSNNSKK